MAGPKSSLQGDDPSQVNDLMEAEGEAPAPKKWNLSDEDLVTLKEREAQIRAEEYAKFPKDDRGRLLVPDDYEPPSGFSGRIFQSGMELAYPGWMISRDNKLEDYLGPKNTTIVPKTKVK